MVVAVLWVLLLALWLASCPVLALSLPPVLTSSVVFKGAVVHCVYRSARRGIGWGLHIEGVVGRCFVEVFLFFSYHYFSVLYKTLSIERLDLESQFEQVRIRSL